MEFDLSAAITSGSDLFDKLSTLEKFGSKYDVITPDLVGDLVVSFDCLAQSIPKVINPVTTDDVYQAELGRRVTGEAAYLHRLVGSETRTFEEVLETYGISQSDVAELEPWLLSNKEGVHESLLRLYTNTANSAYKMPISADIPEVRYKTEAFAKDRIQAYFKVIGALLERTSGIKLSSVTAVPTTKERSYFNNVDRTLAVAMEPIIYSTKQRTLNLDKLTLLRLIGHEGMGHALNNVASNDTPGLPFFLKRSSSLIEGTAESVAQHFETEIFDEIAMSPETQSALGIKNCEFARIHQEVKDTRLLEEYRKKFLQYALTVLADKSLSVDNSPVSEGALRIKHEKLMEVTLATYEPAQIINANLHNFDMNGNLNASIAREMRYAAQPVQKALQLFAARGITDKRLINTTFLTGFWTPEGFVENACVISNTASKT